MPEPYQLQRVLAKLATKIRQITLGSCGGILGMVVEFWTAPHLHPLPSGERKEVGGFCQQPQANVLRDLFCIFLIQDERRRKGREGRNVTHDNLHVVLIDQRTTGPNRYHKPFLPLSALPFPKQ